MDLPIRQLPDTLANHGSNDIDSLRSLATTFEIAFCTRDTYFPSCLASITSNPILPRTETITMASTIAMFHRPTPRWAGLPSLTEPVPIPNAISVSQNFVSLRIPLIANFVALLSRTMDSQATSPDGGRRIIKGTPSKVPRQVKWSSPSTGLPSSPIPAKYSANARESANLRLQRDNDLFDIRNVSSISAVSRSVAYPVSDCSLLHSIFSKHLLCTYRKRC